MYGRDHQGHRDAHEGQGKARQGVGGGSAGPRRGKYKYQSRRRPVDNQSHHSEGNSGFEAPKGPSMGHWGCNQGYLNGVIITYVISNYISNKISLICPSLLMILSLPPPILRNRIRHVIMQVLIPFYKTNSSNRNNLWKLMT